MPGHAQLFSDLIVAETRLFNRIDRRLQAEHDMTLGAWQVLGIIARGDGCRAYDIAHEIDITVGAASKAVDRIEARGWCRRRANPEDGRSSLLALTAAGRRARAKATPTFDAEAAAIFGALAARTRSQLASGLSE